jgi:hypothetical protein
VGSFCSARSADISKLVLSQDVSASRCPGGISAYVGVSGDRGAYWVSALAISSSLMVCCLADTLGSIAKDCARCVRALPRLLGGNQIPLCTGQSGIWYNLQKGCLRVLPAAVITRGA